MRKRLVILLILSALLPLGLFGIISILRARDTNYRTVIQGNMNGAVRASQEIELYVKNAISILQGISNNINRIYLEPWQKEAILKNYVINFEEFRKIYITDRSGKILITTEPTKEIKDERERKGIEFGLKGKRYLSEVYISDNLIPNMIISLPIIRLKEIDGVIVSEINLRHMWDLVDSIRIGKSGYASVVSRGGVLIAHGDPEEKARVVLSEKVMDKGIVKEVLRGKRAIMTYRIRKGIKVLGVAVPIGTVNWGIIIEEPIKEAYALSIRMTHELLYLAGIFLLIMVGVGSIYGRRKIVNPIKKLIEGTEVISKGDLSHRVEVDTGDELQELAGSFNEMTEKLIQLNEEIKRNERAVTFGRIAAGLVHDLRHPIRNIENSSKLISIKHEDKEYREKFKQIVEREFKNINRFLDDLYNLTHPTPLNMVGLKIDNIIEGLVQDMDDEFKRRNIIFNRNYAPDEMRVKGDRFALERVFRNLITNAMDAMPEGGELTISTKRVNSDIEIRVSDTGCGIEKERIKDIFTEYTTTKRKGLGLGLPVSKKIIDEHRGRIEIESKVGVGTTFIIILPASE
jgi:signal transduction histidine kinase